MGLPNWLIERFAGAKVVATFKAAQLLLSGKKTYVAGAILILQGSSCLLDQLTDLQNLAALIEWAKAIHSNECMTKIAEGLGLMGLRAGVAKMAPAEAPKPPA